MKAGDPVFEKCIEETASKTGVRSGEVRSMVYKAYPIFHPRFGSLPDEIVQKIILEINPYTVSLFCSVSKRMKKICKDNTLWKRFWEKYLPSEKERRSRLLSTFHSLYMKGEVSLEKTKKAFAKADLDYRRLFLEYISPDDIRHALVYDIQKWKKYGANWYKKWINLREVRQRDSKKRVVSLPGLKDIEYDSILDLNDFFKFSPKEKSLTIPYGVWSVDCSGLYLKRLSLPEGLIYVDCSNNSLETLVIPTSLVILKAFNNILVEINLKNTIIAELQHNKIEKLRHNPPKWRKGQKEGLEILNLNNNQLRTLDLSKANLERLGASFNRLQKIILPKASKLRFVLVQDNELPLIVLPRGVTRFMCDNNPWKRIYVPKTSTIGDQIRKCAPKEVIKLYSGKMPNVESLYSEVAGLPRQMPKELSSDEIIEKGLTYHDIIHLCSTSHPHMCQDDEFWHKLFERDFGPGKLSDFGYQNLSWQLLYRNLVTMQGGWLRIRVGKFSGLRVLGGRGYKGSRTKQWKLKITEFLYGKPARGTIQVPEGIIGVEINTLMLDIISISSTTRVLTSGMKKPPKVYALTLMEVQKYIKYLKVLRNVILVVKLDKNEDLSSLPEDLSRYIKANREIKKDKIEVTIPPHLIGARTVS